MVLVSTPNSWMCCVPSRSEEGGIKKLSAISQSNNKDVVNLIEPIHQSQQLVHQGIVCHPRS